MYRIIGSDGRQYGPVTLEQTKEWIAAGRANALTLAQAEGTTEWKPLGSLPEFAEAFAAKAPPLPAPPVAPAAAAVDADRLAAEIVARDYRVEIGHCLGRSWDLLMANFWLLVGATFVLMMIVSAVGLLGGVCYGGLFYLLLRLIRGERAEFGDAFCGFTLAFLQLFLAGLVVGLLGSIGFLLCILPGIYLMVAWKFTLPLVIDKRMDFWPAMELSRKVVNKHWWTIFGLLLVNVLVNLSGLALCCVGMLITVPLTFGAVAYAYEDIFGAQRPPAA